MPAKRERLSDEPVLASTEKRTAGAISAQLAMPPADVEAKELKGSAAEPLQVTTDVCSPVFRMPLDGHDWV